MSDLPKRIIELPLISSLSDVPETARIMVDSAVDSEDSNTGAHGLELGEIIDIIDEAQTTAENSANTVKQDVITTDNATHDLLMANSTTDSAETNKILKTGLKYNPLLHSLAEGVSTTASGTNSHAEGENTTASGSSSHAEGSYTTASGNYSHAEGHRTVASASCAHAEGGGLQGDELTASGRYSHAEGYCTIANHGSQHVFGEYNVADSSTAMSHQRGNYVEIVGNGTSSARSNARTLDWNGNEVLAGKLTIGVDPTNDMDVTTKRFVETLVNNKGGIITGVSEPDNSQGNDNDIYLQYTLGEVLTSTVLRSGNEMTPDPNMRGVTLSDDMSNYDRIITHLTERQSGTLVAEYDIGLDVASLNTETLTYNTDISMHGNVYGLKINDETHLNNGVNRTDYSYNYYYTTITGTTNEHIVEKMYCKINGVWEEVPIGGGGGGTTVIANPSGTATANLNKVQIGSTIYSVGGLEIIDTLEAGETELTISNNAITTTATYDFFTDAFGVSPTDVEVTAGQIVLTFEEQQSDVSVKVRIS